ncbi:MAG: sigma-70 family RNA polymerase sigma factor [Firmicutes bacterium]|nr:sigma-70 family RNA polymerase sigma factor [Bacillota bacterium]
MELEDEAIIRSVLEGDQKAFADLVEKYQRPIYNLAGQMVGFGEDARDLTQEIFLTIYRKLGSFKGESRFSTWIYRVASNQAIDWVRKKRRPGLSPDYRGPTREPTPEEAYLAKEGAQRLRRLLDGLPEKYRIALVLHYYHGFSYQQIAETLEVSQRTVETRIYRGRLKLREQLGPKPKTTGKGGDEDAVSMAEKEAVSGRPAAGG